MNFLIRIFFGLNKREQEIVLKDVHAIEKKDDVEVWSYVIGSSLKKSIDRSRSMFILFL